MQIRTPYHGDRTAPLTTFVRFANLSSNRVANYNRGFFTLGSKHSPPRRGANFVADPYLRRTARRQDIGQQVTLCGWVDTYRDHSGVLFIDLRDRYGKTQVVFAPESGDATAASRPDRCGRSSWSRSPARWRRGRRGPSIPKLATGEIEVRAEQLEVLNRSLTPPFQPDRQGPARRGPAAEVPLHRSAAAGDAADAAAAAPHDQDHARLLRRAGLHRRGDAHAGPQHARGRPRLPGAQPRAARACSTPCRNRRSSTSRF